MYTYMYIYIAASAPRVKDIRLVSTRVLSSPQGHMCPAAATAATIYKQKSISIICQNYR